MTANMDVGAITETVSSVLADHPVVLGFLFGSQVHGDTGAGSDIDIAVVFEQAESGGTDTDADSDSDRKHRNRRLQLDTDLALALGTDDVDVIDLRSAPPSLVRTVFQEGKRIVGSEEDARELQAALLEHAADADARSPTERFDDALAAIDDHLG